MNVETKGAGRPGVALAAFLWAAASSLLPGAAAWAQSPGPLSGKAAAAELGPAAAFLGLWVPETNAAGLELRYEGDGRYSVYVASVTADARPELKARLGSAFAWGFSWDPRSGSFSGGRTTLSWQGAELELSCSLRPGKDGSLEFKAWKGLVSRSTLWRRPDA